MYNKAKNSLNDALVPFSQTIAEQPLLLPDNGRYEIPMAGAIQTATRLDELLQVINSFAVANNISSFALAHREKCHQNTVELNQPTLVSTFSCMRWLNFMLECDENAVDTKVYYRRVSIEQCMLHHCSDRLPYASTIFFKHLAAAGKGQVMLIALEIYDVLVKLAFQVNCNTVDEWYKGKKASLNEVVVFAAAYGERLAEAVHFASRKHKALTDSEKEILYLLSRGYTRKQIAEIRYRAGGTVDKQISQIISKLGAANTSEAVLRGKEFKLI